MNRVDQIKSELRYIVSVRTHQDWKDHCRYLIDEVERLQKEYDELWDQAQTWREESGN